MRNKLLFPIVFIIFIISSCTKELPCDGSEINGANCNNSRLKIAVVADIHYMDPSLLRNGAANGAAFQEYISKDPKLLQFSAPIFREVISELKSEKPDILLVPGDLTKDGEVISHQAVAAFLQELQNAHIKVYVVPGNHDVKNPEAATYNGDNASPVASVSAADFSSIYSNFGYGNAIARDANSLSYVCEPHPGLWILGIDDCKYEENKNIAIISGRIKPETMKWIQEQLAAAKQKHITVLGMMHHNLIEHYKGESQFDPGYVVDNWEATADALMASGLEVIFTGHYHANDVTKRIGGGNVLFDIETGSLVTAPIPYRMIEMKNKDMDITTLHVTSIASSLPGDVNLETYSNLFLSAHLDGIFSYLLTQPPFSLSNALSASSAPLFRNALMAHYAGDEMISPQEKAKDNMIGQVSPISGIALSALWTDLPPRDNNLHIHLGTP